MNISAHALMMALKALNQKTKMIASELENAKDPELSYFEEELHLYSKALSELRDEYISLQKQAENLPTYEDLIA